METPRTIVVGDVHGCGQEFLTLLTELAFPLAGDRLIFVGDLFDRGPLPQLVLETFLTHAERGPKHGYRIESVCGNHDVELLAYCRTMYAHDCQPLSVSRTQEAAIQVVDQAGMLEDLTIFLERLGTVGRHASGRERPMGGRPRWN